MSEKYQQTETSQYRIPITIGKNTYNVVPDVVSLSLEQERDELREKYDTEATEHMLAVNKLCNERDELRDVLEELSLYLSVGMGDETTTAKQYKERILEGIKMLTDPLMDRIQELERHSKELQSQVYYEQMKPYKIECEKNRLIEELDFLKEKLIDFKNNKS